MSSLARPALAAYAAVALPLAAAALPVHVLVPKFYAGLGLDLALVGLLLLSVRLLDAVSDPLLGALADRVSEAWGGRRLMIAAAVPLLASGLWLLFNPPADPAQLVPWLAVSLIMSHLGLSAGSIAHFALGSALTRDHQERTRVTAARGVAALAGVLAAAAIPETLVQKYGPDRGLALFAAGFAPLLVAAAVVTLLLGPRAPVAAPIPFTLAQSLSPLRNPRFRRLALVFLVNGVAAAVPATLLLFYVTDVLQRPDLTPLFLLLYFAAGAAGMPLWVRLAAGLGKVRAWLCGMACSVTGFVSAFLLGDGDAAAFAAVCVLSGLAFGADLALPASLLADVIDDDERGAARPDGTYFGLWHLLEKLALALAAGIALPLLQALGYQPGQSPGAMSALSAVYALLPCVIKLAAAALLWRTARDMHRPGFDT